MGGLGFKSFRMAENCFLLFLFPLPPPFLLQWKFGVTGNAGKPWSAEKRKRHFCSLANLGERTFTTEHVWTFEVCQHLVDMSRYELDVLQRFDLCRHLDGQPTQFQVKDRCGLNSFSFPTPEMPIFFFPRFYPLVFPFLPNLLPHSSIFS